SVDAICQLVADGRQIGAVAASGRMRVGELLMPEPLPVLDDVECKIRHNSIDPWTERFAGFEPIDRLICLDKSFLCEVLGVIGIANDAPGDRYDSFHVF